MSPTDNGDTPLLERGLLIGALYGQLLRGEEGLSAVPKALARVLREGAWRDRIDTHTRQRYTFDHFMEFAVADAPAGLGSDLDLLVRLVRGTEAEAALNDALRLGQGSVVRVKMAENPAIPDRGARWRRPNEYRAQTRDRLQRKRPDLLALVDAGELSLNAAAVTAGIRRRQTTVDLTAPTKAVRVLLRHFTADELRQALNEVEP